MKEYVTIVHGFQTSFHKNTFWRKQKSYLFRFWQNRAMRKSFLTEARHASIVR
jgi:hypothetical protein